jgi:hypothetical protein
MVAAAAVPASDSDVMEFRLIRPSLVHQVRFIRSFIITPL